MTTNQYLSRTAHRISKAEKKTNFELS
jgi:hypothetical protein